MPECPYGGPCPDACTAGGICEPAERQQREDDYRLAMMYEEPEDA